MTTPVNKIIQTLESILEQCKDKKDLATHNQIKDSSIYYEGMVDVLSCAIGSFKDFSIQDENEWREEVVRDGDRIMVGIDGEMYEKNLAVTCIFACHSNREEFCDRCHGYVGVEPFCWDCHAEQKGNH